MCLYTSGPHQRNWRRASRAANCAGPFVSKKMYKSKDEQYNLKKNGHIMDGFIINKKDSEDSKVEEFLTKILKYYIDLYKLISIYRTRRILLFFTR